MHRNLGVMLSRGFGFISGAFGTAGVLRRARRVWVDVSDGQDPEKKKPGRRGLGGAHLGSGLRIRILLMSNI